jgi:flagellar hook protein FlgE
MSFYTSLSGLNAAQTNLNVTSNNIANVGTTGFKSSRAEFGDLISASAFQAQNSVVGSGTRLKAISQEFSQGSTQNTGRALDLMISGSGFFVTKSTGAGDQVSFTRAGSFTVNSQNNVVDDTGNVLQVLPVDSQGNATTSGLTGLKSLLVPPTNGSARATSSITQSLNMPTSADLPAARSAYATSGYSFSPNDANSYNNAVSTMVYDTAGNAIPATTYYVRTANQTKDPTTGAVTNGSTWTAHTFVGDQEVFPAAGTANPSGGTYNGSTALTMQFDASGNLTSPSASTAYTTANVTGASAPISLSMNFSATEGNVGFSTVANTQDGNTVGQLSSLTVGNDGLVSASYSDGTTLKLGKLALANFTNPQGLHQNGNTSWTATGLSGDPKIAAAGSDGATTIASGQLETSNVDLSSELVNLISEQRNFQANAKAIDTDKQMLQSIIQVI